MKVQIMHIRVPEKICEVAKRVAEVERRSINAQLLWWLENGGIPADLLDETKADIAPALAGGKK